MKKYIIVFILILSISIIPNLANAESLFNINRSKQYNNTASIFSVIQERFSSFFSNKKKTVTIPPKKVETMPSTNNSVTSITENKETSSLENERLIKVMNNADTVNTTNSNTNSKNNIQIKDEKSRPVTQATIDPISLKSYSSTPTITGTAYNVSEPFGISISNSGGKVWASGDININNNRWTTTVNETLSAGKYFVHVYSNNILVTSGILAIASSPSPSNTNNNIIITVPANPATEPMTITRPTITRPVTTPNSAPMITKVTPSERTIRVGEKGIWTVYAIDKEGNSMTYKAYWRDGQYGTNVEDFGNGNTMTHAFDKAGTYNVIFAVRDSDGNVTPIGVKVSVVENTALPVPSVNTEPVISTPRSDESI